MHVIRIKGNLVFEATYCLYERPSGPDFEGRCAGHNPIISKWMVVSSYMLRDKDAEINQADG